jgi:hypothetical protein
MIMRKQAAFGISSLVLVVLLAGCSANAGTALHASTTRQATTTSSTALSPTSNSTSVPPSRCHTSDLTARFGTARTLLPGQDEIPLIFTNISGGMCTIFGFPGFTLLGPESNGSTTFSPERDGESPTTVVLAPGSSAYATFTWLVAPDTCDNGVGWVPAQVMTTPPDETTTLTVSWDHGVVDNCQGAATRPGTFIAPVQVGTSSTTTRPTLGRSDVFPSSTGFGQVEPSSVFLGGEAESAVTQIAWSSWGASQATGIGTGCYYGGTTPAASCSHEPVTLFAYDLGACGGLFMYQKLEYVYPGQGETFDPGRGMDICTEQ